MGKTNHPLVIVVSDEWDDDARINALRDKGHTIRAWADVVAGRLTDPPDLIFHPNAWQWSDSMWPMLEVALKAARAKRPRKGKKNEGK